MYGESRNNMPNAATAAVPLLAPRAALAQGMWPRFPGLPNFGTQNSYRTTGNSTLRSTFGSNVVNELKGGFQWSPNDFFSSVMFETIVF